MRTKNIPDLGTSIQDGEKEYNTLDLSRLFRRVEAGVANISKTFLVLFVVVTLSFVTFIVIQVNDQAQRDSDTQNNRITSCLTIRELQLKLNGTVQGSQDLVNITFNGLGGTPEQRETARIFAEQRVAALEQTKITDVRDCTPQGISRYYKNLPNTQPQQKPKPTPLPTSTTVPGR